MQINVMRLSLAKERVFVNAQGVGYAGTVDGYFDSDADTKRNGRDIANSLTLDSVAICLQKDFSNLNLNAMVLQNVILSFISLIVCSKSHCQFACICDNFSNADGVQLSVCGRVSVAELSFCFVKQGVRKCKHKFRK